MRRRVGIVVGACAALALAGAAGAAKLADPGDTGRPVGTWHDAPAQERGSALTPAGSQAARERVGTLRQIDKLIGYAGGPQLLTFHYPQASYVKLHFGRLLLLPGDYVTVSAPNDQESYRYAGPPLSPGLPGAPSAPSDRWAMSVAGDTAVVELHRIAAPPADPTLLNHLGALVDQLAQGYPGPDLSTGGQAAAELPAEEVSTAGRAGADLPLRGRTGREESVCGGDQSIDAVCYQSADPMAWTRSQAVARLLINGTELCTGWRIGARNRMITNHHCFDNSVDAYQAEVWFNYRCVRCGGTDVLRPTKVWGAKVLATNRIYDYTVFTVDRFDLVRRFGYLRLDTRRPERDEELYVPQHPAGQPTKIAGARGEKAGNCEVVDPAYDGYGAHTDVSYYCDTQGGSSGSPVLSRVTDKVVALHHFGGCPNSGVRADLVYARIKRLL